MLQKRGLDQDPLGSEILKILYASEEELVNVDEKGTLTITWFILKFLIKNSYPLYNNIIINVSWNMFYLYDKFHCKIFINNSIFYWSIQLYIWATLRFFKMFFKICWKSNLYDYKILLIFFYLKN